MSTSTIGGTLDYDYIYLFVKIAIVTAMIIGLVILLPLAILKRDTFIITQRPFLFAAESFLIGVVPGLAMLFFTVSRGIPFAETKVFALTIAVQFVAFHILFQISGLYKYLMGGI